jgi:hypothetical protein
MKTRMLGVFLSTGFAALAGCFSGTTGEDTTETENAATAAELDDTFVTTVLSGGCSIVVDGQESKTAGSDGACPNTLSGLMDAFEKNNAQVFIVSEKGDRPNDPDASFRFVVAAKANNNPFFMATVGDGNLSEGGVEAIGWSPKLQAFAYYKVEGRRWRRHGDGSMVKSTTKGEDRPFACITCHKTGAPLMKELHDSWGNWTSTWDSVQKPNNANALFNRLFSKVQRADFLEPIIVDGIKRHSKGRVDRAKKEGKLKGVLTQLMCEIGEPSLVGAHSKSQTRLGRVSSFGQAYTGSLFFNQLLLVPGQGSSGRFQQGFEQSLNLSVPSARSLSWDANAYAEALEENGQTIGGQAGDAIFPMSSPEKSAADIDAVQELLRQNPPLIDQETIADALMTDYTVPAFSEIRCNLANTIPDTWSSPEDLRTKWSSALGASNLRGAKGLKARLDTPNQLQTHAQQLDTFARACTSRPQRDLTFDMVKMVSQRRTEFLERYESLVESPWLIPENTTAKGRVAPHGQRLSATSCLLEPQSAPFDGEN